MFSLLLVTYCYLMLMLCFGVVLYFGVVLVGVINLLDVVLLI